MAITNTDEFLAYSSFNSAGGVTTSDTFNTWRKKTNGIIYAVDGLSVTIANISVTNVAPSQLSLGAPTWNTSGALSTYGSGSFTAGAINGTSLNVGSGAITAGSFNTVGTITYGTLNGAVVVAQTVNSTNSITAALAIRSNGTLTGKSLAIQTGTNAVAASIGDTGIITGSSLTVGSGAITCGAIAGTSLNVGSGAITCGAITGTTITASGDIIAFSTSDRKFKNNIANISDPLDKVSQINGVTFDWNDQQSTFSGSDVGVIAQEVEAVLPEIVSTREDGSKAVKYDKLVALLIECVKELKSEIDALKLLNK